MGCALLQGIMTAGIFAYISGTPFIYQKIYGVSHLVFSIPFSLNGISLILGTQLVKRLAGRLTGQGILLVGIFLACFASFTVLIVVISQGSLFVLVILLLLFYFIGWSH